ncbi:MAG: hypothetical protein MZU84_05380 [Sphingobacterium sp.]|nr:hypothetical protein [Sphingobacterium sp.]
MWPAVAAWPPVSGEYIAALVWLNLLFLLVPLWRSPWSGCWRAGWRWRQDDLATPLFWLPFAALVLLLTRLWLAGKRRLPVAGMARSCWNSSSMGARPESRCCWRRRRAMPARSGPEWPLTAHDVVDWRLAAVAAGRPAGSGPAVWFGCRWRSRCGTAYCCWHGGWDRDRPEVWRSALEMWLASLPGGEHRHCCCVVADARVGECVP